MSLEFLNDKSWDFPFFKKLSSNDTGEAPGHQAGMVITRNIRKFFPALIGQPTRSNPTIEHYIRALLLVDGKPVDTVTTRYQIQSWRGTRSPETRLTGNLSPLRGQARGGDYLVIQRNMENLNLYRLSLIRQNTPFYSAFSSIVGNKSAGLVGKIPPVTQDDMDEAATEQRENQSVAFKMFDFDAQITKSYTKRTARSLAFRKIIQALYNNTCCACGTGLKSPLGQIEVEAAHIVPKRRSGSDDARNGLAFCKRHHWAFDHGLFTIDDNQKILLPEIVRTIPENRVLLDLEGNIISSPSAQNLSPHRDALSWHREYILVQ